MTDEFQKEIERIQKLMELRTKFEKALVKQLGDEIGYGRMMQLAKECWRDALIEKGNPEGGEFQIGACVALTVSCECDSYNCDWCCGSGWLTQYVKKIKEREKNEY